MTTVATASPLSLRGEHSNDRALTMGSDLVADLPRLEELPPLDACLFTPSLAAAFALPPPRPRATPAAWRGGSGGASASGRPGTYGSGGASGGGGPTSPPPPLPVAPPPPALAPLAFFGAGSPFGTMYYDAAAAAALGECGKRVGGGRIASEPSLAMPRCAARSTPAPRPARPHTPTTRVGRGVRAACAGGTGGRGRVETTHEGSLFRPGRPLFRASP